MIKVIIFFVENPKIKGEKGMNRNKTFGRLCKRILKTFEKLFLCIVFGYCTFDPVIKCRHFFQIVEPVLN
jgi:hypothetical protein